MLTIQTLCAQGSGRGPSFVLCIGIGATKINSFA